MSHATRTWIQRLSRPLPIGVGSRRARSRHLRSRHTMLRRPDCGLWSAIDRPRALRSSLPETERLEVRALLSVTVSQNFPDINFNQTSCNCTPPDTMMAVGPTNVVGAVNTALVLKGKTGNTSLAGPVEFSTFFSSIHKGRDSFSDPQVVYDDQAGRYYVGLIEYPSSGRTGYFDFAASNSSSPTGLSVGSGAGQWTVFSQISSVNEGGKQFPDFPKMGWNNDAVFVSFNQFGRSGFSHDLILAIAKSSITVGGTLTTHQTVVNTGSDINILIPARMHNEATGNLEYFVQATGGGAASATVNVVTETGYNSGAGTFTTKSIAVTPYTNSPGVPGLTGQIDDRMLSAAWINNNLVASMDVGEGGLNLARWYEFTTSGPPAFAQQGDITAGSGVSTSYPSIAIDPAGDIGMTYIQSSSTQPYSMYVTGRLAADPVNTMQTGVEVIAGVSPVPGANRGGDYSATEYDSATSQFWSANEYNLDSSGSNFHWGTQIASYTISSAASPVSPASVTSASAPSRAPIGTASLGPLALYTHFTQPGPSGLASTPNRTGIDPGIAILDMYANGPEDQVPGLQGIGLPLAARGKPRSAWGR
jgi:hypothetical protein